MRGRYPKSSSIVNNGKKIAIGGSITEMTHVRVVYIPSIVREIIGGETDNMFNAVCSLSPVYLNNDESAADG